jgi:hypothetical protein
MQESESIFEYSIHLSHFSLMSHAIIFVNKTGCRMSSLGKLYSFLVLILHIWI